MTEKRFTPYKNNDGVVGFKDNITGKHHCSIIESRWLLNHLWEQTQRFEKHNQRLMEENMGLKERNNRQYKQLKELHTLIEHSDWETLIELNNELKENEEQLQREWKCYNGE